MNRPAGQTDDSAVQPPADWPAILQASRDWIERLIVARTKMPDLVDDVLQEVSLAVARSRSRPAAAEDMAPWLCKIVVRQCALTLRHRGRQCRKLHGFHDTRQTPAAQDGDPIFWLLQQEQREILRRRLAARGIEESEPS